LDIPGRGDVRNETADFSGLRAQEAPEIERDQMTVLIYVDTSKQVGDSTTSRCSPTEAAESWFEKDDPEGVAFEYPVIG
jgi:hypothetical protein